jgi:hypothetical protein
LSERGVFAVDRGIWDHPEFADEPLTEREAWQWLICEAAFKARKKRIGATVFDLERGQLACSLRFMAEAWQWKKDKVARFLKRLETATMIATQARHDATVITVCNYDRYQKVSLPPIQENATPDETRTRQERDKLENTKNTEVTDDDAAPRGALVTPEAMQLAEKLLVIAGHKADFWPPGWCGAPMRVQAWLNQGWDTGIIVATVTGVAARKRGPPASRIEYFENAIAEEIARQAAPLPVVEVKPADKLTVTSNGPSGSKIIQAADDLRRKIASFGGRAGEEDGVRSGEGANPARLLSHG